MPGMLRSCAIGLSGCVCAVQARSALTSGGLRDATEDAGHAAHEGRLAAACSIQAGVARSSVQHGLKTCIEPKRKDGKVARGDAPESAARPMTTVLSWAALTTRARRPLEPACECRRKGQHRSGWGSNPGSVQRITARVDGKNCDR